MIVCRSPEELSLGVKQKISTFCHVSPANILSVYDVSNIYHVPLILEKQGLHSIVKKHFQISQMFDAPKLESWKNMALTVDNFQSKIDIAIVGKYVGLQDSYLSLMKALKHSAIHLKLDINLCWVEASDLEDVTKVSDLEKYNKAWQVLKDCNGILVPGGFGIRGVAGKIEAARFARENKKPYLGVCLGMQIMVIEYARNVMGIENATSTEFEEGTPNPVVIFMPEINQLEMGGTMRLGARETSITLKHNEESTLASIVYGLNKFETKHDSESILERHRHRYEVNPDKVQDIENAGLLFSGRDDQKVRMEIAELSREKHPFYFGTQFHPEFKSRPNRPSPPFFAFAAASAGRYDILDQAGVMWRSFEEELEKEKEVILSSPLIKKRKLSLDATTH